MERRIPHNKLFLDERKIVDLYEKGSSAVKISKEFNCSPPTINRILRENNIKIIHHGHFKKEHTPFNKGLKGWTSKSSFKKGQISWSKGLTKETDERVREISKKLKGMKKKEIELKEYFCIKCGTSVISRSPKRKYCKECIRKNSIENTIRYQRNNREKTNEKNMKYRSSKKGIETTKKYAIENKDKIRERGKKYREKNREYNRNWRREYRQKNKEIRNKKEKIKRDKDKNYKILILLRNKLGKTLRHYTKTGKIYSSKKYGIDYKAIIEHLKPFPSDLSKYHIDHIKPLYAFQFVNEDGSTNLEEVKKAFAPENHQWLLAEENLKKGRSLIMN